VLKNPTLEVNPVKQYYNGYLLELNGRGESIYLKLTDTSNTRSAWSEGREQQGWMKNFVEARLYGKSTGNIENRIWRYSGAVTEIRTNAEPWHPLNKYTNADSLRKIVMDNKSLLDSGIKFYDNTPFQNMLFYFLFLNP